MKIKTDLVFLGFAREIVWRDLAGDLSTQRWTKTEGLPRKTDRKRAGVFITSDAKILYLIPWVSPRIEKAPAGFELQKKVFERWASRAASESIKIYIPSNFKKLGHVGYIEEIQYTSDKFDRPGDHGKYNLYIHEFAKPGPALFVNCPIKPYMWGVNDPKGRKLMTYRGLVL